MEHELPIAQYEARAGILDLGWGHPSPAALPVRSWQAATETTLTRYGWQALAYGHPPGPGPLIEWLAAHLSRTDPPGVATSEVFVTAGASHALELVTTILTEPGDLVVVDSPTYHLALGVLANRGVEIVGAPADADGIDPAATGDLIAAAHRAGRRVPMLYIVPTFANPTGRCLPDLRRRALVELAQRSGTVVVEDDTYRDLVYDGAAPPSLYTLAGGQSVVRIGSFAKTVAPGLRLGWINTTPQLVRTLAGLGYVHSGGGVNHTAALTMATFGMEGWYDAHLVDVRDRYAGQRDALINGLREKLSYPVPSPAGGWFVWLGLPEPLRATTLLPVAERFGVSYLPGPVFYAGTGGDDHIRLSFSLLPRQDLTEAAHRLAAAIETSQDADG